MEFTVERRKQAGMSALFRQEVRDPKRNAWLGPTDLAIPGSHRVTASLCAAARALLIRIPHLGRYDRQRQISGASLRLRAAAAIAVGTVCQTPACDASLKQPTIQYAV